MKKYSFSLNDHYKWGFNDGWFNDPEPEGYFKVSIGSCSRPHKSFREECINSAKMIGELFDKPIVVGFSGGSDSQVICLSMLEAKVPFTPIILVLVDHNNKIYNSNDVQYAFMFCKKFGLEPFVETLNIDEFYCGQGMKLIQENCITVPEMTTQLYLVIKYKDTHAYINGGGDPLLLTFCDEETQKITLRYSLGPLPIQQFLIKNNIQGCLKFFMYSPELIASYMDNNVMRSYLNIQPSIPIKDSHIYFRDCIKPMLYFQEWPEVTQRIKNHGYEEVWYIDKLRKLTSKLHRHINPNVKKVNWTYEEIVDHLNSNTGIVKTWSSEDERNYY